MTIGRLITRDTELDAPDGYKVVVVMGTMLVPADAPLGANRMIDIEDDGVINIHKSEPLPAKYALWDGPAVSKEVLGIESMRDSNETRIIDRGLSLLAQGEAGHKEMPKIVKYIEKNLPHMPENDPMRTIMKAIVNVVSIKTNTPAAKPTRRKKA